MDKKEIIIRLKGHLKARKQQNGELNKRDLDYCTAYVMDFLLIPRKQAKQFLADNLPEVASLVKG